MEKKVESKKSKKKKLITVKTVALFLVFNLFFVPITSTLAIRYVPYLKDLKRQIVNSAMVTLSHQWIAKLVASQAEIDEIVMQGKYSMKVGSGNGANVGVEYKGDKTIKMYEIHTNNFDGKLLIVNDPKRIKVGVSKYIPKAGETTSSIAARTKSIAAINAGGFSDSNYTGTGGDISGITMTNGKLKVWTRNTKGSLSLVGFNDKGVMIVGKHYLSELKKLKIREAVDFGPALVVNGEPMIKSGDGNGGISPRTAIGQSIDGRVLLLVLDGRDHLKGKEGATYRDVQDIMLNEKQFASIKCKAYNAVNLDGGSSTTMYYDGRVVNNPCNMLGERSVPSVFLVKR